MRLPLFLASLALLLALCEGTAVAQVRQSWPAGPVAAYPATSQPGAFYSHQQLRPLPPVEEPPAPSYAQQAVAPAGHWVFVPAQGEAMAAEQIALPPPRLYAEQTLPAPAVTDFAHVPNDDISTARSWRLGPTVRIFEPKARVYFDTGWEAADKLSLFHDGELSASINFIELYWQHRWSQTLRPLDLPLGHPDWRWGPAIGVGIAPQAGPSSDGSSQTSGAPVLMLSAGLQFDFPLASSRDGNLDRLPTAGLEFGYALGISSDESLDYIADGAIYVGVTIHVLP